MQLSTRLLSTFGVVTTSLLIAGCTPAPPAKPAGGQAHDDHDHDHDHGDGEGHPETYAKAVEQIVMMNSRIKHAFDAKDTRGADGPVHAIGHLLEDVGGLAEQAGLNEEQRTAVHDAVQKLFAAFADVDGKLHGKEGKDYGEVSAEVEAAIEVLKQYAAEPAPQADGEKPADGDKPAESEKAADAPPAPAEPAKE